MGEETVSTETLSGLYTRRKLADYFIRYLMANAADDPRQPDALAHYKKQQAEIDAKITAMEKAERQRLGLPEPEPVVVCLKPAKLFGEVRHV